MTVVRIESSPEGRGSKLFVDEQEISGNSVFRITVDATEGTTLEIEGYDLSEDGKLKVKEGNPCTYGIKVKTPMTISVVGDFERYLTGLLRVE